MESADFMACHVGTRQSSLAIMADRRRLTPAPRQAPGRGGGPENSTGKLELVNTEAGRFGPVAFKPGWQWYGRIKPIAETDSLPGAAHGLVYLRTDEVLMNGQEMGSGRTSR